MNEYTENLHQLLDEFDSLYHLIPDDDYWKDEFYMHIRALRFAENGLRAMIRDIRRLLT